MGTGAKDEGSPKIQTERAVDVALAEFAALRTEIASSKTIQSTFIGVGLTVIGAIFAFALQKNGSRNVLSVVPPLTLVIDIIYQAESVQIGRYGTYIRENLWKYLEDETEYPHSWEQWYRDKSLTFGFALEEFVFRGAITFLLAAIGAVALLYAHASTTPAVLGWVSVALTFIIPIGAVIADRMRARSGNEAAGSRAAPPGSACRQAR